MKEIRKMRQGILRELKNVRIFFDNMERTVKNGNPDAIQKAYIFLSHMVYDMDKGKLTPSSIALDLELARALQEDYNDTKSGDNNE